MQCSRRLLSLAHLVIAFACPSPGVSTNAWGADVPQPTAGERHATAPRSIRVPSGFHVELVRSAGDTEGSWISLSIDATGRMFLGLDDAGVAVIEPVAHSDDGAARDAPLRFRRLAGTDDLRHVRGILHAHDSLYVVATDSRQVVRLFDDDGDGEFERRRVLAEIPYASRYGHGMNQIVQGPDGFLYLVVGNDVALPSAASRTSPYRDPRTDWLLPSPHDLGQDDRVGYIARLDPEGGNWSVVAGGFRNPFDCAFDRHGECFTWDADMEWDAGLPWYRPTRLNHVVAGGEYGWRWGSGKWPAFFPDSLPTTLDTGLGSPTGMVFGHRTAWPGRFRELLYMADWQHGRMLGVYLEPHGASFSATAEVFLEGAPLNICDIEVDPRGDLVFVTGGRGSQSGLYRVRWTGEAPAPEHAPRDDVAADARATRRRLERLQESADGSLLAFIVEHLDSADLWLRFTARVALEHQPLERWRSLPGTLQEPSARRAAALALARIGPPDTAADVLDAALADDWSAISDEAVVECLRIVELSIIRQREPDAARRVAILRRLPGLHVRANAAVDWLVGEMLVRLRSTDSIEWLLRRIESAASQEEAVQAAKSLSRVREGWAPETARRAIAWLDRSIGMPGGRLVETTWRHLRSDFEVAFPDDVRSQVATELAGLDRPWHAEPDIPVKPRPSIRRWTVDDLLGGIDPVAVRRRDPSAGLNVLAAAGCLKCHRHGSRGTHTGPELTHVGRRFDIRAIVEAIVSPSRQIDPKYALTTLVLDDGRVVTGRSVGVNDRELTVEIDPTNGSTVVVSRDMIDHATPADRSPMPVGLLDGFTKDEILDLLALLQRGF